MGVRGVRSKNKIKPPVKKKRKYNTLRHKEVCDKAGKWLKKHSQNILIPNCPTVAIDMTTCENEIPDVIGWYSGGSIMIEVKVNRGDFLSDYKKPFRRMPKLGVGDFRYYCCPTNLIKEHELPTNWGLLYISEKNRIKIIKVAEKQISNLSSERNMLLSIIRRLKTK
ncbi:MAG: hypothetical protein ACOCVF_00485 [bacterium]